MSTRFTQVTRLTAAALAAVAVLAACSPGDGIAVQSTAGTATPSPELLQPETKPSNEEAQEWVTAPRGGKLRENSEGDQYGPELVPGVVIAQEQPAGPAEACTVGPAIDRAGTRGFLTAGHCDKAPGRPVYMFPTFAPDPDSAVLVGTYTDARNFDNGHLDEDAAELWTGEVAPGATRVAGDYPVAGVLTTDAAKALPRGTPVCYDGAFSGLVCGPVIDADDQGKLRFDAPGERGNSGAAVFLLDRDLRAILVGIQEGGHPRYRESSKTINTTATYLAPELSRRGVRVLLDPSIEPATGSQFSTAVTR